MRRPKPSLRSTLAIAFLLVGSGPLWFSNQISSERSTKEIQQQAAERAKLVASKKAEAIQNYFRTELEALRDLSLSPTLQEATLNFSRAFNIDFGSQARQQGQDGAARRVESFYQDVFGKTYLERTGEKFSVDKLFSSLDEVAVIAQDQFIASNPHPLGKKDELLIPDRLGEYGRVHAQYHPYLRQYLNRHGLYDLFLFDLNGRLVYSVFKETDFGTSLTKGPWAKSGLGEAFQRGLQLKAGEVHLIDFARYTPSFESPASFAAIPLERGGERIGVLAIQFPLDRISQVTGERDGLGEKGETILTGSDLRLRADTFRNPTTHNVAIAFKGEGAEVETEALRRAAQGQAGFVEQESYDQLKTLAYYLPLQIENLRWLMVAELSQDEVYAGLRGVHEFSKWVLIYSTLAVALIGFLYGAFLAWRLKRIARQLASSSRQVSDVASQTATSATDLSESAMKQAAGLEEAAASIEEISAMVKQNSEMALRTRQAVDDNLQVSKEGTHNIEQMRTAMTEIRETNEEVSAQMQETNQELGEILGIISQIEEKTKVINDIVFQTKLLSFNASVEAARAGEHGKGFAVVAEEVGNLARMSGSAATEIRDLLSGSVERVNTIVDKSRQRVGMLLETGQQKIVAGEAVAARCFEDFEKIAENAQSMTGMMATVAEATKQQTQGLEEVGKAVTQLDQATQQNASMAEEGSAQAVVLSGEAVQLTESVDRLVQFVDGQSLWGRSKAS